MADSGLAAPTPRKTFKGRPQCTKLQNGIDFAAVHFLVELSDPVPPEYLHSYGRHTFSFCLLCDTLYESICKQKVFLILSAKLRSNRILIIPYRHHSEIGMQQWLILGTKHEPT